MSNGLKKICFLFAFLLIFLLSLNYIYNVDEIQNKGEDRYTYSKDKTEKYTIIINVDIKRLEIVENYSNETIKSYPVATGKAGSPTPLGTFKIVEKGKWGEGFGTRWMGLDVPWGKYGIHGTNNPGSIGFNLSAGCIRMRNRDIEELYDIVRENSIVHIINGLYGTMGNEFRTLRPGDRGADVLEVQKRLSQKGYYKSDLDGIYGELMKTSLLIYLKDNNIEMTDSIDFEIYNSLGIILME